MRIKLIILSLIVVTVSACTKNFLDVNNTPNNPLNVPPATLLPNTTIGMAFANSNELGRFASILVQYNAGDANQVLAADIYNLDNQLDNQWSLEIYGNTMNNLRILIESTQEANPKYAGIAKIQLAYLVSMATDLWGDVPYSQAGFGTKFVDPRFDKQEDIYQGNGDIQSLFDLVKEGMADLDKTSALAPGNDDLIYKGDLAKWKRAGNSMLLKFAMQISNKNPTLAKSTIDAVITGNNYINANTLDFEVPFGSTTGNQNPLYSFNNVNRPSDQQLSVRYLNLMKSLNDTIRLAKLYTKPNGVFGALENGLAQVQAAPPLASRSKYNTYLTGNTGEAPIRLITNSQVQFILAEAALILGTSGDPNAYYQAGIRAHMAKVGMTQAEIDNYFATNPTVVTLSGTTEEKRRQIITQKYIALTGNGIEAYNDYRRTGYPILAISLNTAGDDPAVLPTRFPYTPNELARNPKAPSPRPLTNVKLWFAK